VKNRGRRIRLFSAGIRSGKRGFPKERFIMLGMINIQLEILYFQISGQEIIVIKTFLHTPDQF